MTQRVISDIAQTSTDNEYVTSAFINDSDHGCSFTIPNNADLQKQPDNHISGRLLCAIVAAGVMVFVGILTETMTNVLFPTIMEQFRVDASTVQWLTTGYLLTVSIVTPLSGFINRRFTCKSTFAVAALLCVFGLLLAACAPNFWILMTARVLQGMGTGIALPLMFNIILEQSPRSRLGLLMGVGNMVCAIAPALGPMVGGVACVSIGWRAMFAWLTAVIVLAFLVGFFTITQPRPTCRTKCNVRQLVLLFIGFVCFVFALDQIGAAVAGASMCWLWAIGLLVASVIALTWFAMLCRNSTQPLIRMGILRNPAFRWHLLAYVMLEGVTIGFGYLIPNLSQLGFHSSPALAGLLILPGALLGAVLGPVAGALLDRFGAMRPIMWTMALAIVGVILMLVLVSPSATVWMIGITYVVYMAGFSMAYPDTMTAGMSVIQPAEQPDGNAMFSTFQQLAGAVGTTVMSICLVVAQSGNSEGTAAYATATQHGGKWAMAVLLVVLLGAFAANWHAFKMRHRLVVLE